MGGVHDGATLRAALSAIASDFSFTWIAEARNLFIDSLRGDSPSCTRRPEHASRRADRRRPRIAPDADYLEQLDARAGSARP